MSRIVATFATTALTLIESGMRAGNTLDLGVLAALNAGLENMLRNGIEPGPNEPTALSVLLDRMFDPSVPNAEVVEPIDPPVAPALPEAVDPAPEGGSAPTSGAPLGTAADGTQP
jgi:hypothetical protein